MSNLSDVHRGYLNNHAVEDTVIEAAGIFSEGDWVIFPFRDGDLTTNQRRLWPGPPGEYLWTAGQPLHLAAWRPVTEDSGPVIIAEGTKQSLAVASWAPPEYAVYGMPGRDGWRRLELTRLSRFEGHKVLIMLDADAGKNLDVYESGELLAVQLDLEGAQPSFIPSPSWGKGGIDDWLATVETGRRERQLARLFERAKDKPAARRPAAKRKDANRLVAAGSGTVASGTSYLTSEVAAVAAVAGTPLAGENTHVSGAALLDEVFTALTAYVYFQHPDHAVAAALYAAASHAVTRLQAAPRLRVKSPVKQCGKTRLLQVLIPLVRKALSTANVSAAALVRCIELDPVTLVVDETDAVFGTLASGDEKAETLRGILNAGFDRGSPYIRYNAMTGLVESFPTFAMVVLAGIGDLPDTIEDRSVIIAMARKPSGTAVARFRIRRDVPVLLDLGRRLGAWVTPLAEAIAAAEPVMPDGLTDRAEDVWEPLIAVADAAGGRWPGLARNAAQKMAADAAGTDNSTGTRLLADIRTAFGAEPSLWSYALLARLNQMEESPWRTWNRGQAMTASQLSGLLRPFGIGSVQIKDGGSNKHGYYAADFTTAWAAYLPDPVTPSPSPPVTPAVIVNGSAKGAENAYPRGGAATAATAATAQVRQQVPDATLPLPAATSLLASDSPNGSGTPNGDALYEFPPGLSAEQQAAMAKMLAEQAALDKLRRGE